MKKHNFNILILFAFACFISLTGCEEDVNTADLNEAPKIAFSISEADLLGINLGDTANYPTITGTVQADAGLQEVVVALMRGSETEVLENVTTFDEVSRIIFVIDTLPVYTADLTSVRVSAVDEQGRTVEKELNIETYVNPEFDPLKGLPGTTVTVTGPQFVEEDIESVAIGEVQAEAFTVAADGSITFDVPEGAITDKIIINRVNTYPYISAGRFVVLSEEPKTLATYNNVITRGQGVRNDPGMQTAFSAQGETFTLMDGTDEETSRKIDFITADSGGDDALDLFAPGHGSWLPGNYFEDSNDVPVVWPVLNPTQMQVIPDVGEEFFTNATMEDIQELTLDAPTTRVSLATGEVGVVILFETAEGEKGLIYYKAHDPKSDGSKGDEFVFDIKVIE